MNRSLRPLVFVFGLAALAGSLCACEQRSGADAQAPAPSPKPALARGPTGSIDGSIRFDGPAPTLARIPTNDSVARHCGTDVEDRSLVVSPSGGVASAIASVDDVAAAPSDEPGEQTVVIDNKGCAFTPVVLAARAGATVAMKNSDPLTHSIHARENGRDLYNVAIPLEGMVTKKVLPKEPGIVRLVCDIHPWMNARIKTFAHPYFAAADAEGHFRIEGIPVGRHTVTVWHPRLGEKKVEVEVKENAATPMELHFASSDLRALE